MNKIKTKLELWGNWARCGTGTEFSKTNITFREAIPESNATFFKADDVLGMQVDAAVAKLKEYDDLAYNLIIFHYVFKISQNKLAKQIGKAQSYIATLLKVAEAFLAGLLAQQNLPAVVS